MCVCFITAGPITKLFALSAHDLRHTHEKGKEGMTSRASTKRALVKRAPMHSPPSRSGGASPPSRYGSASCTPPSSPALPEKSSEQLIQEGADIAAEVAGPARAANVRARARSQRGTLSLYFADTFLLCM